MARLLIAERTESLSADPHPRLRRGLSRLRRARQQSGAALQGLFAQEHRVQSLPDRFRRRIARPPHPRLRYGGNIARLHVWSDEASKPTSPAKGPPYGRSTGNVQGSAGVLARLDDSGPRPMTGRGRRFFQRTHRFARVPRGPDEAVVANGQSQRSLKERLVRVIRKKMSFAAVGERRLS